MTPLFRTGLMLIAALALPACATDRFTADQPEPQSAGRVPGGPPGPVQRPPVEMAGRWTLSSPGRGQCAMTFAGAPGLPEGTIAPEGGCPGQFFTSRKWTFETGGLVIRNHNSEPLAALTLAGSGFNGQASNGEAVNLVR